MCLKQGEINTIQNQDYYKLVREDDQEVLLIKNPII